MDELFKEKLDIKREVAILSIEAREAAKTVTKGDLPVAVSFLNKQDKESLLKRLETLEKAGVKVNLHSSVMFREVMSELLGDRGSVR